MKFFGKFFGSTTLGSSLLVLTLFFFAQPACASAWKSGALYSGSDLKESKVENVIDLLPEGGVAIVSEQHDFKPHHRNQVLFLNSLASALSSGGVPKISVGMEFIDWTKQEAVDLFVRGVLTEPDFLKSVGWGGNDFSNYRTQVLFPRNTSGSTLALNAPRSLTSRIAKVGISGLTQEEKELLPPDFEIGNRNYFERFRETMVGHVPESAIQKYFEAQSVWDDTMAWTAAKFLSANPQQRLVIIVGDFHATYGGGLPDRLIKRGVRRVVTISQVNLAEKNSAEENETLKPHPQWGPRADFIWVER